MKRYAIFHAYIGDRSVVRLDGRWSMTRCHAEALDWARKHRFTEGTYTIERGQTLLQTFALSKPRSLASCIG